MPLVSYRNAQFIQNEITGINITDETVNRFHPEMTKQEAEKVGVEICREVVRGTWDIADGYYFSIPFYRAYLLGRIMEGMPHDAEEEKG
jgi:homocysteine S-methyltransferase